MQAMAVQVGRVDAQRGVAIEMFSRIIMRTPVDTGRLRGNWQASLDSPMRQSRDVKDASGSVNPVGAGDSKAKSEMIRIVAGSGLANAVYLVNNLPYAGRIEYGYSKRQAPKGMVRLTIAEFQDIVEKVV